MSHPWFKVAQRTSAVAAALLMLSGCGIVEQINADKRADSYIHETLPSSLEEGLAKHPGTKNRADEAERLLRGYDPTFRPPGQIMWVVGPREGKNIPVGLWSYSHETIFTDAATGRACAMLTIDDKVTTTPISCPSYAPFDPDRSDGEIIFHDYIPLDQQ